jgi:aerobic carbon-monoxide dehydrogenase medium subunit
MQQVRSVDSVDEALQVLAAKGGDCQILAGGTDVMIQLQRREIDPPLLLHIERLAELRKISGDGAAVKVGPLVTHRQLAVGALGQQYRAVAEAAATVGGLQTQSVGTVGGNVCNASPAADTLPALLVHDAQVTLRNSSAERTMTLEDFITGRRATRRSPDELLTGIILAGPRPRSGDTYLKVGRRSAMEVAIVGLAVWLHFDDAGLVGDARIALASVGPRPVRAPEAEAALVGRLPDEESVSAAGAAAVQRTDPIDDVRGSADYRRRVIPGLLKRAVGVCAERAGFGGDGRVTR